MWGAAYRIPGDKATEVTALLDIREMNGYSIQYTPFYISDSHHDTPKLVPNMRDTGSGQTNESFPSEISSPIHCLVYIGLPNNPQFLGPQDPQSLASHILHSRGPSGDNKEYLYNLDEALKALDDESWDEHVADLASRCRALEADASQSIL